jgi:hypothetical protein
MSDTMNTDNLIPTPFDEDISDSDLSGMSSEDEEEPPVTMLAPKKASKAPKEPKAKAPKKKAAPKEPKKTAVKVPKQKKPRTVRRPYKSMPQEKLEAKQLVAHGRFEVVSKRMGVIQGQLARFDHEIATREAMPAVVDEHMEESQGL